MRWVGHSALLFGGKKVEEMEYGGFEAAETLK
jgi:hypothetical protein